MYFLFRSNVMDRLAPSDVNSKQRGGHVTKDILGPSQGQVVLQQWRRVVVRATRAAPSQLLCVALMSALPRPGRQ